MEKMEEHLLIVSTLFNEYKKHRTNGDYVALTEAMVGLEIFWGRMMDPW
jgi:hypothetical protein